MADYIKVNPSPNRSTIDALVVPSEDGIFAIDLIARAKGNGHDTPQIWSEIQVDGQVLEKSSHVPWQDGDGSIEIAAALPASKGKIYKVRGLAGNVNADATGVELKIERIA